MEVLERVRKRAEPAVGQETAQADLDPRSVAKRRGPLAARPELGDDVVFVGVGLDQGVDLGIRRRVDTSNEVANAVAVDAEAEPALGLDLVAVSHGDLAHVLAEAGDPAGFPVMPGGCGPAPRADTLLDLRVGPVPHDDLPLEPQARSDEAELAVAVGGLVQIHEVHVDLGPWDLAVVLGVEVEQGLAQSLETGDPHLGRRERVHPGDEPDAGRAGVGLVHQLADPVGPGQDRLDDDPDGDGRRAVEGRGDPGGVLGHVLERLWPVQVLTACDEPDLVGAEREHW